MDTNFWNPDLVAFDPAQYSIAINLFIRLLGALYIVVYLPFLFQMLGLFGKNGIRPIDTYLKFIRDRLGKWSYFYVPSVFWINASDAALLALVWAGMGLGFLLMLGVWPPIILLLLYIIHLSLTSAGQEFLSFGWEMFLMEITIGAMLMTATTPYNIFGWLSLNFLILRFHVQAGASKFLSGDKNWRNLTAISFHYLTQPLPNTVAWYLHKLPMWCHKISTLIMHWVELVVPWFIFMPPEIRLLVFIQLVGLQFCIWFSGNLSYLNHMTLILCLLLLNNRFLEPILGATNVPAEASPLVWQIFISILGAAFLGLQIINLCVMFFPTRIFNFILSWISPFHLAATHGIFAIMTTKRYEIIVEGSNDAVDWQEYEFYFKPGDLSWRPRRISPFQPRIDWQAWFLPFGYFGSEWWFQQFLIKLLEGSPPVLKLMKHNPFSKHPPVFIRAMMYDYEFTTIKEKAETGNWWKRKYVGVYAPAIKLKK